MQKEKFLCCLSRAAGQNHNTRGKAPSPAFHTLGEQRVVVSEIGSHILGYDGERTAISYLLTSFLMPNLPTAPRARTAALSAGGGQGTNGATVVMPGIKLKEHKKDKNIYIKQKMRQNHPTTLWDPRLSKWAVLHTTKECVDGKSEPSPVILISC